MSVLALLLTALLQEPSPTLLSGELLAPNRGVDAASLVSSIDGSAWIGYAIRGVDGSSHYCDGVLRLEGDSGYRTRSDAIEGDRTRFVLVRVQGGKVQRVRLSGMQCVLDSGGIPVYWFPNISTEESLSLLDSVIRNNAGDDAAEAALRALAQHDGVGADRRLDGYVLPSWPLDLREKAVFWMGAARGDAGFGALSALVDDDAQMAALGEKIVFAIHVSDAPRATDKLIALARGDRRSEIRAKSLFWLSQEASAAAVRAIEEAVREDPEIEIKKKAVFALSQLPSEEGVPLLIEVAETHPSREVRKKAFFWLGQTGDPQALALFERVLRQ